MPRGRGRSARAAALLLLVALAAGCAQPVLRRDWSGYDGPGAAAFHRETLPSPSFPDPLEPMNRSVFAFNHVLIAAVADPVGHLYRLVLPRFARDRLRDFAANLVFPRNLVANLVQGRWRRAGDATARFVVNTTVGIAGLFDPATHWVGIEAAPQDFGQVFARWGWRPSTFVVLPILGPSTLRDGIGLVPDAALDPATYFFPAGPILTYNGIVDAIPEYRRLAGSSFDFYDDAHFLWVLAREATIEEPDVGAKGANTGATQTLEAAFLGPRNPDFRFRLTTREVLIPATGRVLPYTFRLQPGRAPLVFLVPGLGTHRLASASLALAEMAWERGFSVAIVSSAMNFEFIERAASVPVPGHAPVDARDVHAALDAVARDLDARRPGRVGARIYLGYSLGAFHGFFIAARQRDPANDLVRFDRYLLLDPPVRLIEGMERLDAFYDVPLAFPEPERDAEVRRILLKAVTVGRRALRAGIGSDDYGRMDAADLGGGTLTSPAELPFTNEEAKFLIGLAFRRSLQSLLYASQEREDLGVLLTERRALRRLPAYEEIGDYSFTMYFYAFVLPYYRDRVGTPASSQEMVAMNDLRAIAEPLRASPELRVFANRNDFLTSEADVEWLKDLVGSDRVRFFPTGGHLGNLHRPEVQAEVMDSLDDLLEKEPGPGSYSTSSPPTR